jgi:polysaccharide pyruvyl transferase WcaK-like protein
MPPLNNPIKLFITGLCLQGNKGGPAIALSMREVLSRYLLLDVITLSVPGGKDFDNEQRAAQRYAFKVVEVIGPKSLAPPFCFAQGRLSRARAWLSAFLHADVIIDMTAISYVGPPIGRVSSIFGGRFFYFFLATLMLKKFMAWTQSYGPLSTPFVQWIAKLDLSRQPIVFCRGDDCAEAVRAMLPSSNIHSFPDVATMLPFDKVAGQLLLNQLLLRPPGKLVTISPSAVIYTKTAGTGGINAHVLQVACLCNWLIEQGYDVVLVPHTLRLVDIVPERCDLEVCNLIYGSVKNKKNFFLLKEDIGASDLKNVISNAHMHIGARYHSIVAGLSAGVPCISLSWHPKYRDLMRAYGVEQFVFDATVETSSDPLINLTRMLSAQRDSIHDNLLQQQLKISELVDENARLFCQCINKN